MLTKCLAQCCAAVLLLSAAAAFSATVKSDLADAAMRQDKATVQALLQQRADVNVPQADGGLSHPFLRTHRSPPP